MWALFLLIFNFQTMSWDYANIDGALIFPNLEQCNMPMLNYNAFLEQEKYRFVCEPWAPVMEEPLELERNGEKELNDMLDKFKDDSLNKPDKQPGNNIFDNLGIMEPKGTDV